MGPLTSSFLRFLDHTQRCTAVGRTPLNEWYARRRDVYLTKQHTHNRQTFIPPAGFETTLSADEWLQTQAFGRWKQFIKILAIANVNINGQSAYCPHIARTCLKRLQHEPAMIFVNTINGFIFATVLCFSCGAGIYFCARTQFSRGIYIYMIRLSPVGTKTFKGPHYL
jgi:hypothetical protein